jgi:SagB-type dehydrogenase family enzyme
MPRAPTVLLLCGLAGAPQPGAVPDAPDTVELPAPETTGAMSLEEAIAGRRSVRAFRADPLSPRQIAQLLWALQGITRRDGRRSAPSAGALYPLEVYLVRADGLYRYEPAGHRLVRRDPRDLRGPLGRAAFDREALPGAPAVFVITAVYGRTAARYGPGRAPRYVHLEAGHAAQNLLLQAVALGLGGVPIGAFRDDDVHAVLDLPADERPLYLLPVGRPR